MQCVSFRGSEDPVNLLTSSEIIYLEQQRMFLRGKGKEDRNKLLKLMVSIVTVVNPVSAKSLSIQVTDDDDPFVLYTLIIGDTDFQTIKEQQGLLIEYDKFPEQLIKLLRLCNSDIDDSINYHLVIEDIPGDTFGSQHTVMKIIETNQFKQLCHLSLTISVGNDTEVKKHMAVQLKILKDALSQAEAKAKQGEAIVEDLGKKLEAKNREAEQLQERWCEENKHIHQQTRQELINEREKLAQTQEDLRKSFESEKKIFQEMLAESKKDYESLLSVVRSENKTLFEQNCESESKLREQETKLATLQKDIASLQREAAYLRSQNSKLDAEYHDKEKSLNNLKMRYAVLEQELKDKETVFVQQRELLQVAQEQKVLLEENLTEKEDILQKRQSSLQSLSEEFMKGNEIIKKLQLDNATLKSKLKLRTNIALEQEGILSSKEKESASLKQLVEDQRRKIEHLEAREKQLTELLDSATSKLSKQETLLSNNTNLINWLNRRINELQTPSQVQPASKLASASENKPFISSTPHIGFTPGSHKTFEAYTSVPHIPETRNTAVGLSTQRTERIGVNKDPGITASAGGSGAPRPNHAEGIQTKARGGSRFLTPSSYFPQSASK